MGDPVAQYKWFARADFHLDVDAKQWVFDACAADFNFIKYFDLNQFRVTVSYGGSPYIPELQDIDREAL